MHPLAPLGPRAADLGKREVALRELRAAAVYAVEDVHDHVDGLVGTCHLLDVEVDFADAEDVVQASDELAPHVDVLG